MKARELLKIGFREGRGIGLLIRACEVAKARRINSDRRREIVYSIFQDPGPFRNDEIFGEAADYLYQERNPECKYLFSDKQFRIWGSDFDETTINQMKSAMSLPVSVKGALMPDGHVGYGLPIGGVLATDGVVIPYAVGADIACRMRLTVLDCHPEYVEKNEQTIITAVEDNTWFGADIRGWKRSEPQNRYDHAVMDEDWGICQFVEQLKDLAWVQLGTSGSGNHFVDIVYITFAEGYGSVPAGQYVGILSHSGSRGPGNKIATRYTEIAKKMHPVLPAEYRHLAWLPLDSEPGIEYWSAMELMGRYAAASHELIHRYIVRDLRIPVLMEVENHHNFAWKETYDGRELIVHRKGATPAGEGVLGIIPGSMATPAYLVQGKGNPDSLNSASHGAGRAMSRKRTKETNRWSQVRGELKKRNVTLLSAGLDEVPNGYKDIRAVMAAQTDLVDVIAEMHPRIVKMSDDNSSED